MHIERVPHLQPMDFVIETVGLFVHIPIATDTRLSDIINYIDTTDESLDTMLWTGGFYSPTRTIACHDVRLWVKGIFYAIHFEHCTILPAAPPENDVLAAFGITPLEQKYYYMMFLQDKSRVALWDIPRVMKELLHED